MMNKKKAVFKLEVSVDAELEDAYIDFLKNLKMDQSLERPFMDKHDLSVSQFIDLHRTHGKMIIDMESAEVSQNN